MIVEISAVPNSPRFKIAKKGGRIKIHIRSPPEENKANAELVRELERIFGRPVRIVSGLKSKRKKIEIPATEEEWEKALSSP